jgi:hypothetical protein
MMVTYALWVVAVLVLLVGRMAGDLHQSVVEERRATERAELRAAAISGLEAYRLILAEGGNGDYSHLQEAFRSEPSLCAFQTGEAIRTVCFDVAEGAGGQGPSPVLGVRDEESRLDILRAEVAVLARLPGVTRVMAENLVAYLKGNPPTVPRTPRDLRGIPGWEGLDVAELAPLVSFYGTGRVNLNTASPNVFKLLGLSDRAIREMTRFLSGPNGLRGDADDRFFKGLGEIKPRLREFGVDARARAEWADAIQKGRLTVHSEYYRVRARSVSESTGRQYEVEAIVRADASGTVIAWREYQPA